MCIDRALIRGTIYIDSAMILSRSSTYIHILHSLSLSLSLSHTHTAAAREDAESSRKHAPDTTLKHNPASVRRRQYVSEVYKDVSRALPRSCCKCVTCFTSYLLYWSARMCHALSPGPAVHVTDVYRTICVSAYCYICVIILLCMCRHTAMYASAYCYICVLISPNI
jgi:hypothetical protein